MLLLCCFSPFGILARYVFKHSVREVSVFLGVYAVRQGVDGRLAAVYAFGHISVHFEAFNDVEIHLFSGFFRLRTKDVVLGAAFVANGMRHVLHHADNRNFEFFKHVDASLGHLERGGLRRRHHNGSCQCMEIRYNGPTMARGYFDFAKRSRSIGRSLFTDYVYSVCNHDSLLANRHKTVVSFSLRAIFLKHIFDYRPYQRPQISVSR